MGTSTIDTVSSLECFFGRALWPTIVELVNGDTRVVADAVGAVISGSTREIWQFQVDEN